MKDLWEDPKYSLDLRVAEMLESNTEPTDCTGTLRRLAAEIIRRLVTEKAHGPNQVQQGA